VIQPVAEIAAICHARGVLFHTDAVQAFGKIPCSPSELGVDALSATSHKFYGPHGAGFLWLRSGVSIQAIQHGGFHENERRPGTENVTAIVGMTAAAVSALGGISDGTESLRQKRLREELWEKIAALDPTAIRNAAGAPLLFNTLNVSFPGCDGETLLMGLDLEGIAASSGSACMVGSIQASHVLLAMGVSEELARATVRFSLGRETTSESVDATLAALSRVLGRQSRFPKAAGVKA
jgi:cysteine desulfurase